MGDYDVRGQDLRQLYAGFGRIPLNDGAIWALSLAQSVVNESLPEHIGYQAWITDVAGVEVFAPELQRWAVGVGKATATLKPLLGKRRRALVADYKDAWGEQASIDGLKLALFGIGTVESLRNRAEQFGIDRKPYQRVRNLVAGCVLMQSAQFEDALGWAVRLQRRA